MLCQMLFQVTFSFLMDSVFYSFPLQMVLFRRIQCYGSPGQLLELLLQFPSKRKKGIAEDAANQALLNF